MAENSGAADLEPEETKGYKAPEKKTLEELEKLDQDDKSLEEYKKKLLGDSKPAVAGDVPFPQDPRNVIVDKLAICIEGRRDVEINLRGDITQLKKSPIVLKEGCKYRVKIYYYVQRDIVSGLKYIMASYRGPMKVDKEDLMLGSYAPKKEVQFWISQEEEAPKGMIARGTYTIKSRFTDDDKNDYLTWEWALEIKKDFD